VVSSLIFGSLLLSNALIFFSSEQRAGYSSMADSEGALYDSAVVIQGVAGVDLLGRVQAAVSSHSFSCASAVAELAADIEGTSVSESLAGVSSTATVLRVFDGRSPDDLSILGPFDGGSAGRFDMLVGMTTDGSSPGGAATYRSSENHTLSLPFDPAAAAALCTAALGDAVRAFNSSRAVACNSTETAAAASRLEAELEAPAASEGLRVSVSASVEGQSRCQATVVVGVAQTGISGPYGTFSWSVVGEETLSPQGWTGRFPL
jgi:hypothetical protein